VIKIRGRRYDHNNQGC